MTDAYTIQPNPERPEEDSYFICKDGRSIAGPGTEAEMRAELGLIERGEV